MKPQGEKSYRGLVRELVVDALTEDELRTLCLDHFYEVHQMLSAAMSPLECARRLVDWCYRRRHLEFLVNKVKDLNEDAYNRFASDLGKIKEKYPSESIEVLESLPPFIIHPLPPAPDFVGREKELWALDSFLSNARPGLMSLIGLGSAGKTAITAEFLRRVMANSEVKLAGVLVWSFYVNQDINEFMEVSYQYFSQGRAVRGSGPGILYQLVDLLGRNRRYLMVLDGLERVQRPKSDAFGIFGDLTDPILGQLVARMAAGLGMTKCIITSRFPLTKLEPWLGTTYSTLDIDQLQIEDARLLLSRHVLNTDDAMLDSLIEDYGTHALTLDHLGSYLKEFCDGNPARARTLPQPQLDSVDPQERRLARVLTAYESALSNAELALLSRLCLFRFGIAIERLHSVFASGDHPQITGPLNGRSLNDFNNMLKPLIFLGGCNS